MAVPEDRVDEGSEHDPHGHQTSGGFRLESLEGFLEATVSLGLDRVSEGSLLRRGRLARGPHGAVVEPEDPSDLLFKGTEGRLSEPFDILDGQG